MHDLGPFFFKVSYGQYKGKKPPFDEETATTIRRFGSGHDFRKFQENPDLYVEDSQFQSLVDLYHFLFLVGESDLDNPENVLKLSDKSAFTGLMSSVAKIDNEMTFPGVEVKEEFNRRMRMLNARELTAFDPLPFSIGWAQDISAEIGADSFFEKRVILKDPILGALHHLSGGDLDKVAQAKPSPAFFTKAIHAKPDMEKLMNT